MDKKGSLKLSLDILEIKFKKKLQTRLSVLDRKIKATDQGTKHKFKTLKRSEINLLTCNIFI